MREELNVDVVVKASNHRHKMHTIIHVKVLFEHQQLSFQTW